MPVCLPSVIQHLPEERLHDLTPVTVGGEACNAAVADRFGKPGRRLFNGYGPNPRDNLRRSACASIEREANDRQAIYELSHTTSPIARWSYA